MNYTEEEIQAAVEQLVLSSVQTPQDALGTRNINEAFNQIQEAAAGLFLLYFNAPFYVVYLGSRRLIELVNTETSLIDEVVDSISALDRVVFPISDLSPLANARAALGDLASAIQSRNDGFKDIEVVPAYRRYVQNLDSFLNVNGRNVRRGGEIVQTPQNARKSLPVLISQLSELHTELVRRAKLLSTAIADFGSLNLPQVAASGVFSRARQILDEKYESLAARDENARLEILRETVLDLLAQKAVVKKYGAALAPTPYYSMSGEGVGYSDASHLATPAKLSADIPGPYNILEGNNDLAFTMDGGSTFTFPLPLSFVAELNAAFAGPYLIDTSNDELGINNDGTLITVPLTQGASRTAQQVADEVNTALAATTVRMEAVFFPLKLESVFEASDLGGTDARFTLFGGGLNGLNIQVGDELEVFDGPNAGTTWTITAIDSSFNYLDTTSGAPVIPDTMLIASVGSPNRALRLYDNDPTSSLTARRTIGFVSDVGGRHDLGAVALGFTGGTTSRSRPTLARDVVSAINGSLSQVRAETALQDAFTGRGRTNPTDPTLLVVYRGYGLGDVDASVPNQITLSNVDIMDGVMPIVGDVLVLREGPGFNTNWTITSVTDTTIVASGLTSTDDLADCEFEAGPTISANFGWVLRALDGVDVGEYIVAEPVGSDPLAIQVERIPPIVKFGDLPIRFAMAVSRELPVFVSPSPTVQSEVVVESGAIGVAAELFFVAGQGSAIGTTSYIQIIAPDTLPKGLVAGDLLEIYETSYKSPSQSLSVIGIDSTINVVQLSEELPSDFTIDFGDGESPPPFARFRLGQVADYTSFSERLTEWLSRREQQPAYFENLTRLINPLMANRNPTAVAVRDATREVEKLLAWLTESGALTFGGLTTPNATEEDTLENIINAYSISPVDAIDTLLNSYREKGADRAIDTLLEGRFSDFFGLSMDGVSYSGSLLSTIRDVAREDMPMRKYNTDVGAKEKLLSQVEEVDHEFDTSDSDEGLVPDPPLGYQD